MIGHTEYDFDTPSGQWSQREYTSALLSRLAIANSTVFKSLELSSAVKLGRVDFPTGTTLHRLCIAGAKDSTISHEVFTTLLAQLQLPTAPPVLFALDNLNQVSLPSAYRDPNFNVIHAHDLALPVAFLGFLNGSREFARGALILAATSSAAPRTEALEYALKKKALPPYSKLDPRIAGSIEGAGILKVGALEKEEAKGLLEYCRNSGLLREPSLNEEQIAQKYALSSGIAKEIVAGCVRLRA